MATSGMYLGSAAAMLVLPEVVARADPGALLKLVGALGFAWLLLWAAVGREVPHRYPRLISQDPGTLRACDSQLMSSLNRASLRCHQQLHPVWFVSWAVAAS